MWGPCLGRSNCEICRILPKQDRVVSHVNGSSFRLRCKNDSNCRTKVAVYCLSCIHCGLQYIGCTRDFRARVNNHKSVIRRKILIKECHRLYEHFQLDRHSVDSIKFTILETPTPARLEACEATWIRRLDTVYPNGLNSKERTHINRFDII